MFNPRFTPEKKDTRPLQVYYDLNVINNDVTGNVPAQFLRFNDVRNNVILENPSDYMMSICRFEIDTSDSLPIFIPIIQKNQLDPNLTVYSFTLQYEVGGNLIEYQKYVSYIPDDLSQPLPQLVNGSFQTSTYMPYYYMRSYQAWIKCLNTALSEAFNELSILVGAAGGILPTAYAPWLELNPDSLSIILNADMNAYDEESIAPSIKLFCNSSMYTLLSSFSAVSYGSSNITNGKNYRFKIYTDHKLNTFKVYEDLTVIQMFTEGPSCVGLWNPVSALVFTTATMPVVQTMVASPQQFNSASDLSQSGDSLTLPSVTDFVVPWSSNNTYANTCNYEPSGELRFIDLCSNTNLTNLELSVYWRDRWNSLHPFYLRNQCHASLKILFRRKDFYNMTLN